MKTTTRINTGLNGTIPKKRLTKRQKEFIEIAHQARGMFKAQFKKGLMKHPER